MDCFGIGGIVAFALTGEPPFSGSDATSILARQLAGDYGAARFDAPVARFLQRALAADPKARYPDAAAMREAWRPLRRDMRRLARARRGWLNRILRTGQS